MSKVKCIEGIKKSKLFRNNRRHETKTKYKQRLEMSKYSRSYWLDDTVRVGHYEERLFPSYVKHTGHWINENNEYKYILDDVIVVPEQIRKVKVVDYKEKYPLLKRTSFNKKSDKKSASRKFRHAKTDNISNGSHYKKYYCI